MQPLHGPYEVHTTYPHYTDEETEVQGSSLPSITQQVGGTDTV